MLQDTPKYSGSEKRWGKPFGTVHPFMICCGFGLLGVTVVGLVVLLVSLKG